MKKLAMMLIAASIVLAAGGVTQAAVVTLVFDPNDLIDLYPASAGDEDVAGENKATQENARRVHATWTSPIYETFHNPADPQTQPDSYNTYRNWRDGLTGESEGIAMFNNWFLGWSGARTWGEKWVAKTDAPISATAADGWNWREIREPYRAEEGACIQWWTTNSAKYIRNGGADIGSFSVTVDLYEDTNENGMWDENDADVNPTDVIRMWVGNLNGDDAPLYRDDTQAVYFDDQGWGSLTPAAAPFGADYSTGAGDYGSGFEGVLTIPEPATMSVLAIGGLAALIRRKRKRQ